MKKIILLLLFISLISFSGYSQIWDKTDEGRTAHLAKLERTSQPAHFSLFNLNLEALTAELVQAPQRSGGRVSTLILPFPGGDGELKNFRVYEANVVHPELAVKYPDMKSYVGQGVTNPSEIIRFSISPFGFHNMMLSTEGTSYTDPYTTDLQTYMVYKKQGLTTTNSFSCGVTEDMHSGLRMDAQNVTMSVTSSDGLLRIYRLAMACTIEYAAFHVNAAGLNAGTLAQKKAAVLAAMVVTVTRINSIYERDLSITLQLVPNNEDVIFIDFDNFDNSNTDNALLEQSQPVIDSFIGFDNYDIGHTVSTGGGGVAQLWSPCSESKATGITGLPSPVGDPFDVDYVAHEMGHQFGGNHSYNNSCGGNRSDENAYEPGSGSTIMAYAGICGPNVQNNSDDHFHANSIAEMTFFITTAGNCAENEVTGNMPPVVDAGPDRTIPFGTAFILSGAATDANGDALTYNWEQMDREISEQPPLPGSAEGPNFRSLPSKNVPERYMPDIVSVLNNDLAPTWEVIANVERHFDFAFTVRDNNVSGGQVITDDMRVNVSGTAGPFIITSPNTNVSWQAGTNQTVTWNVAGTTANGVNTLYVDILLSTDGGFTYPVTLGAKIPNDGSEVITIPNLPGNANRIMVKGYENIFYDLSNNNFTITAPAATMAIAVQGEQNKTSCVGSIVEYTLNYNAYAGFNGTTSFSVTGNPAGLDVTFNPATVNATGAVTITVNTADVSAPGFYSMAITATSGAVTKTFNIYLDLLNADFDEVILTSPENNATAVFSETEFTWSAAAGATAYQIEVATDAEFTDIVAEEVVDGTAYTASLSTATEYFWRISPLNEGCAGEYSAVRSFTTGLTACSETASADVPVSISPMDEVTVTSSLTIAQSAPIQSISVSLNMSHTWIGDITASITSPQGITVQLFSQECNDLDGVNATFDDNGTVLVCGDNPALSGLLLPDEPLSAFNGQSPQGVWTLTVSDSVNQDGGAVNAWSLDICSVEEPTAGLDDVLFNDFALYPNPNNGDFTVKFTTSGNNPINIAVYDVRGRQLFNNAYAGAGVFEQDLSLGNAEAGVYLVQVQDGERSITKKIIVK